MKIKIEFTKTEELVPFDYLKNLNGYLHKILGDENIYHDSLSLYSSSFLHGGKMNEDKTGLNFLDGSIWYISSPDLGFMNHFIKNIYQHKDFIYGMTLKNVVIIPNLIEQKDIYKLNVKSPILLKQYVDSKSVFFTYKDDKNITSNMMKNLILKKSQKFGMNFNNDFDVEFDLTYQNKKTKWVKVKSIHNRASLCPIIVKTSDKKIVDFIYDVGVGHSTGSGFGFVI